jgi:hypothetical protein
MEKKYSSKDPKGRIGKDKGSMTEKRNQRELLWFQTGEALNFITAAPHCGDTTEVNVINVILGTETLQMDPTNLYMYTYSHNISMHVHCT